MTVSLMNMLGGRINLTAAVSDKEEPGVVALESNGDAEFETVMAAAELKEVSAKQLQQFFAAHGVDVDLAEYGFAGLEFMALNAEAAAIAQTGVTALPGDVAVGVQDIARSAQDQAVQDSLDALDALLAQLPERELTAEELSGIVQATGLEPIVIFDALRNTPAASPNLAAAMVEDMGAAAKDAGLPLPKPQARIDAASAAAVEAANIAAAASGEPVEIGETVATRTITTVSAEQQAVIQKIVDALQGVSDQPEFPGDWLSRLAALANAQKGHQQQQETAAPVANDNHAASEKPVTAHAAAQVAAPEQVAEEAPVQPVVKAGGAVDTSAANPAVAVDAAAKSATPASVKAEAPLPSHAQPQEAELPAEQVAVHIRKAIASGDTTVKIQLKPAELGAVDVKIETGTDGQARVHVSAERRDTLDMLQRDARALERALQDVGFKMDNGSLSFNLRGDGQGSQHAGQSGEDHQGKGQFSLDGGHAEPEQAEADLLQAYEINRAYSLTFGRGVDISV